MPAKLSREEFLQNLRDTGLFSAREIDTYLGPQAELEDADGDSVAQALIAAGKLTPFQAAAVRERQFEKLVIGNYQVLERLGAGGMGTVYKARHRRMKRVVAIKVLTRSASLSDEFVQRFQREVEAVARLSHPNIVMAHDADEAEAGHFLVMEFVNGRDLATEVQSRGPLPVVEAVDCIRQAARALEYAHGQGIIHRDVKPANLLREVSGVVKVADLGLARINNPCGQPAENASALTQAGTIMGTVDFMSPEQAFGSTNIDHRTDIYSLGCTLYFLLLGRPPYQDPSMMAILLMHREAPIPSLCEARKDVPADLDRIFRRMTAKKPAERFDSLTEVIRALEALPMGPTERDKQILPPNELSEPHSPTVNLAPPDPNDATRTVAFAPADVPALAGMTVLLVEPSRTQAVIIRNYLQDLGFEETITTTTGQQALTSARTTLPRVVISALHLPDMTGMQLARQIRGECTGAAPGFILISTEAESTGIGSLSTCGKAVLLHKPFTSVQLAETLKLVTGKSQLEGASLGESRERRSLRVLIVDDSVPARLHIRNVLAGFGLERFVEAGDGAQAVAAVAREPFDLIVTDYNMPYLDGGGLVAYLRSNPSTTTVPIIMVTTERDPVKLEPVRRLGVAAVCDKSFQAEEVSRIIDSLVRTP
jgi:serine/threonine protein kinase